MYNKPRIFGGYMENLINEDTYMIIKKNEILEIVDKDKVINQEISFTKYLNESCKYYGSTYRGRKSASIYLTGYKSKVPIIISESKKILIFPLFSSRNIDNIWIVYHNVYSFKKVKNYVEVTFKNQEKVILLVSYNIFKNQYFKTSNLIAILSLR